METIIYRVDASVQIGTGHFMRCLSLAEYWQKAGSKAIFVMTTNMPSLSARLESNGIDFVELSVRPGSLKDAEQTVRIAKKLSSSWVVLDGYQFDASFQKSIKDSRP